MTAAEAAIAATWTMDLGTSAMPKAMKAPSRAAPGMIDMATGLTLASWAPPRFMMGVRISVASIHMAPPRLMAKKAMAKMFWV